MKDACRVILVDDHAVVRAGYRMLLAGMTDMNVIGEAETGEEACEKFLTHAPDVVVMDLNLPGIGGLAAIRRIVGRDPEARILVFSIHDEPVYIARALEAGALGYISKSCEPELLALAVRTVAGGKPFLEPALESKMAHLNVSSAIRPDSLTPREFDVLCLLARGYSTREIASDLRLSAKTVANYITLIKEKLNVSTTGELVRVAYQSRLIAD